MTNVYTKNFTIEEESIVTIYLANSGGEEGIVDLQVIRYSLT